jgi:hypothetical protein
MGNEFDKLPEICWKELRVTMERFIRRNGISAEIQNYYVQKKD